MSDPTAVLLADLVDDAGLFPPTQLGMAEALERYRRTSATSDPVLSHHFVCPAARLPEMRRHLGPGEQVRLSVIIEPRADQVAELNELLAADPRLRLAAVETGWPGVDLTEAGQALGALPSALPVFAEVPSAAPDPGIMPSKSWAGSAGRPSCAAVAYEPTSFPAPSDWPR